MAVHDILLFLPALTGGGAERTLVNIANDLNRDKFNVHFLIIDSPTTGKYKDEYSRILKSDVDVINMGIKIEKRNYIRIIREIGRIVKKVGPDAVMTTMLKPNIFMAFAMMVSGYKGKVILRESNNRSACKTTWLEHKAVSFFYGKYASKVIALTKGVKEDLVKNFNVPSNKIQVVYNPIDIEGIQKSAAEDISLKGDNVIVATGRLVEQKDYPTLIKAMDDLKKDTNFHLYILGKGPLENTIQQMIHDKGLEKYITLEGFQANPYKYLSHADVFILSSAWEGFGHVVVEAMTCGAAVVSTNCDFGPGEIITNEENGLLVEVGDYHGIADAVRRVFNNDDLKDRLVKNAHLRANDFNMHKIVREYESVLEKLVDKK